MLSMTVNSPALAFGGRNAIGGAGSSPLETYIEWNLPSLEIAFRTVGMRGPKPGLRPAKALGAGAARMTAPSPGCPTPPLAGLPRPRPPALAASATGNTAATERATFAVIPPPGQD